MNVHETGEQVGGSPITYTQRTYARVVGLAYLLVIPPAIFAEFYVLGQLIVTGNAVETARNIIAHERLFRLGIASNLTAFAMDVVLITALYVVLKPVNRNLALLAAFWGLIETAILVVATLNDFDALRVLTGAEYLSVFEADRVAALARLSISAHGAGYLVGLVFAGLRSAVFCYLWLKSDYIPKPLAALGVFSSLLLAVCTFAPIIFPDFGKIVSVNYYGGPIFIFELTMGFWLVFKGIRSSGTSESVEPGGRPPAA